MLLSDAVWIQLISTLGTIITVLITGRRVRNKVDERHEETNSRLDDIQQSMNVNGSLPIAPLADRKPMANDPRSRFPK